MMLSATQFLKPVWEVVRRYVPLWRSGISKSPLSLVTTLRWMFVPTFTRVMIAPVTEAPLESMAVPRIVETVSCAGRFMPNHESSAKRNRTECRMQTPLRVDSRLAGVIFPVQSDCMPACVAEASVGGPLRPPLYRNLQTYG